MWISRKSHAVTGNDLQNLLSPTTGPPPAEFSGKGFECKARTARSPGRAGVVLHAPAYGRISA